jgi:hypothetical protein
MVFNPSNGPTDVLLTENQPNPTSQKAPTSQTDKPQPPVGSVGLYLISSTELTEGTFTRKSDSLHEEIWRNWGIWMLSGYDGLIPPEHQNAPVAPNFFVEASVRCPHDRAYHAAIRRMALD